MATWTLNITIDTVAVTVTGSVSVKAEESTAKLARFAVIPTLGAAFDPEDYVGKDVIIIYESSTIFTGRVETAVPDTSSGIIEISATDGLQEYFENLTEAQILAEIPGSKWHRAVFGDRQSGWEQAQDALQTVLSEVHYTRLGMLSVGDWTTTGGTTYDASDVTYVSERVQLAPRHTLINKVLINVEYRFTRLWWAQLNWTWVWPNVADFCGWKDAEYTLPSRDMVQSAAEGTGWPVLNGITYQTLPPAGTYPPCGTWTPGSDQLKIDVTSADWYGFRRWSQPIRERYTLTVSCLDSIARYGEILQEDGASYETPYDAAAWDAEGDMILDPTFTHYANASFYQDQDDRPEIDAINELMLVLAQRKMWQAHRQNLPEFSIGCVPTMDLSQGLTINTPWMNASGKIYAYEHRLDTQSGLDITLVTLACPRGGALTAGGSLTAPTKPASTPTFTAPSGKTLPTRIGNTDTAPAYDADWDGYTGNYLVAQGSPVANQIYEDRFRVLGPDIPADARDELIFTAAAGYEITVLDMTLSVTPDPVIP